MKITNALFRKRIKEKHGNKITPLQLYKKAHNKILFKCNICGYKWKAIACNVENGAGCPKCAGKLKHTQNWFNNKCKNLSFKCLTPYRGLSHHVLLECSKGHKWKTDAVHVIEGCKCPYCTHHKKHSTHFVINKLAKRHFKLLSKYKGENYKITLECPKGHIWSTKAELILCENYGCPYCSNNKVNDKYFDHELQNKFKGKIHRISHYNGVHSMMNFVCNRGHKWDEHPNSVFRGGCPYCNGKRSLNDTEFKTKIKNIHHNKLIPISKYKGFNKPVIFKCNHGHIFTTIADRVIRGVSCPYCKMPLGERYIKDFLHAHNFHKHELLSEKYLKNMEYIHSYILHNKSNHGKHLHVDFLVKYHNNLIALEFDGHEHFKPIKYFGGLKAYKYIHNNDLRTDKYCKAHHIYLIRIKNPHNYEYNNMKKLVNNTLSKYF